ncbi:hypothetical protein PHLCEN_2v11235 [Hermanssonia centrifuga]|uniref:Pentacotripeptide-repeat region of PRORP domain-containing protein n=1 Tax=Hermanssonia centrifuga TaxID=98765 RepID=A0A2R6NKU7_9APHY|nr:hypothetical protein PHLCEN_2v11235 [Hermanssonia centrifuga]
MLPKVANQILHHTSRAVAAVQNQTGHTIRNVLQLQSSSGPSSAAGNLSVRTGPSSSSSGRGSNGTGAGGAKYHSSSRFHSGNTGIGRAATLIDPSVSHTSDAGPFDDVDECTPTLPVTSQPARRRRAQSHSLSFSSQERDEQLGRIGVLKTVQLHARSRHAFAAPPLPITSEKSTPETESDLSEPLEDDLEHTDIDANKAWYLSLRDAQVRGDTTQVFEIIAKLRSSPTPSPALYNAALYSLSKIRNEGEPLHLILETYNEMIARSIVPNTRTYCLLIQVLSDRDLEISKAIRHIENRMWRRTSAGLDKSASQSGDEQRIAQLRSENNFGSSLTLFQAACLIPRIQFYAGVYTGLLRNCAFHGNVDAAIHVFSHFEKCINLKPTPDIFRYLIQTYANAGDLQGAKEVFEEFKKAGKANRFSLEQSKIDTPEGEEQLLDWQKSFILVWNEMIRTYFVCGQPADALGLLEQMMDTTAGVSFGPGDIPPPSSSTFTRVISGFCQSGDIKSALAWFDRLLLQSGNVVDVYQPVLAPTKPDAGAWSSIIEGLGANGMVEDMNRLLKISMSAGHSSLHPRDILYTARVNFRYLETHPEIENIHALETLELLQPIVIPLLQQLPELLTFDMETTRDIYHSFVNQYVRLGYVDGALEVAEMATKSVLSAVRAAEANGGSSNAQYRVKAVRDFIQTVTGLLVPDTVPVWSIKTAMRLATLSMQVGMAPSKAVSQHYLDVYSRSSPSDRDLLTSEEWALLLHANCELGESSSQDAPSGYVEVLVIFAEMARCGIELDSLDRILQRRLTDLLVSRHDKEQVLGTLRQLGPAFQSLLSALEQARVQSSESSSPPLAHATPTERAHIDQYHSKFVDEHHPQNRKVSALMAYKRFESGAQMGVYPSPEVIGRLINALGRLGEKEKVKALYATAQLVLASLEQDKHWQSIGWFQIEDHMIIALAHSGDIDAAHVHRARIIGQGGSPSADAYGALIQYVKDTTDDTSNAMALFNEAVTRGVAPNIYLYNTAISKLAKARKADHALELFQEMRTRGVSPTSVTYGAVIAACCRVGDVQSAEILFGEMTSQPNFKPRVPPYNTMMQLYTHTKPDREAVLKYYNALLQSRIKPTAHTYKLLIDAYGTIEPVDIDAMEDVFNRLLNDPSLAVQGTHWAALINAWGCVRKDLDKAIQIFDSIPDHPSTQQSGARLPDAVVFEALINVLVTLRRTDLIPVYTSKLSSYGIHMTAYIANLLIKGYATAGDIEQARQIFESLSDPPEGVAAPNNHAPHENATPSTNNGLANSPVYREIVIRLEDRCLS